MFTYPISFEFEGKTYTAEFEKIFTNPFQFHVYNLNPVFYKFPDGFIFMVDNEAKSIPWMFINEEDSKFKLALSQAIFDKCKKENVPVFNR